MRASSPALRDLKPGDVIECEIEKIGILRNPVISWQQAYGDKFPVAAPTGVK